MNTENDSVENSSTDNSKALSDLIQSIQAKMNTENMESAEENQKVNIDNTNTNNNNISSILNNLDLSSILGAFNNNNNSNNNTNTNTNTNTNSNSNNNTFSGIDPSFLLKAQKVMSSVTRDDPKKNLLLSLKPFLRQSRQDKINEYISMLSIISAIEAFSDKGSDKNV